VLCGDLQDAHIVLVVITALKDLITIALGSALALAKETISNINHHNKN